MPVVAEKKWIFTESEIEIFETNLTVNGFYSGAVLTACMAQQSGYINEEQKINLSSQKLNLESLRRKIIKVIFFLIYLNY